MNETLIAFEQHTGLTPKQCACLLGVAYVTYAHYRSGLRTLPLYCEQHIEVLMEVSVRFLAQRIQRKIYGNGS